MSVAEMIDRRNYMKTIISFNFHSCPTKIFLTCSYNSFVHTLELWKAIFKRLQTLWKRARKIFKGRPETSWVETLLRLGEGNNCNLSRCNRPRLRPSLDMPGLLLVGVPLCWRKASTVWIVMAVSMAAGLDWLKGCKCITTTRSNHRWSNSWCDLLSIASASRNFDALNNSMTLITESYDFLRQLPPSKSYYQDRNGPPKIAVWWFCQNHLGAVDPEIASKNHT